MSSFRSMDKIAVQLQPVLAVRSPPHLANHDLFHRAPFASPSAMASHCRADPQIKLPVLSNQHMSKR